MPPREVAVSFNRARSGGRDRLEQAIILFNREMLEHHAWQRGRRLARFARRVLFILPVLLQLLRLRRHQPGASARKRSAASDGLPVAAGTRVIARIQQDQAQSRHTCDRRPSPTTRMCRARTRSQAVPAIRSPVPYHRHHVSHHVSRRCPSCRRQRVPD